MQYVHWLRGILECVQVLNALILSNLPLQIFQQPDL
jgi:hypothetical protein